jgi:hypothetical protein
MACSRQTAFSNSRQLIFLTIAGVPQLTRPERGLNNGMFKNKSEIEHPKRRSPVEHD